ncbi:hypothetical protein, partial [Nocardia sp. CA-290969]
WIAHERYPDLADARAMANELLILRDRIAELQSTRTPVPELSPRDQLDALIESRINWGCQEQDATDAVIAAGWRPPARVITDPAELDALPGRSIVIGLNVPFPEAWQLTSHHGSGMRTANWGSPYLLNERRTSQQLLDRVDRVAVLHTPENGDARA